MGLFCHELNLANDRERPHRFRLPYSARTRINYRSTFTEHWHSFAMFVIQLAVSATSTTLTSYRSVTRPIHSPVPWLAYHLVPVTASHNLPVARKHACGTLAGCALTSSGPTRLPLRTGFFPGADGLLSHQHANQEVSLLDRRSCERAVRRRCHPSHPLTSRL